MKLKTRGPETALPKTRMEPLADRLGHARKPGYFSKMGDEEFAARAKAFMEEKGIIGRRELAKADYGLYQALLRRKLLDSVFSEIESDKRGEAVLGIIEAVRKFGDSE